MRDADLAALQSHLAQLRTALDRFDVMLARAAARRVPTGSIEAAPVYVRGATLRCANGHANVVYFTPDCPVCTVMRLAGYSEKWCDRCEEITPHVGGMHVHATCVECLSCRENADAALRASRRPHAPSWRDG